MLNKIIGLNRSEIQKRLEILAKTEISEDDLFNWADVGMMCYEMSLDLPKKEYTCITCGEKTVYPELDYSDENYHKYKDDPFMHINVDNVEDCRRYIQSIRQLGYDFELDEKDFCSHCSKGIVKDPKIKLVINYEDKKHITEDIAPIDLKHLLLFLKDEKIVENRPNDSTPLNDYLPRLVQILGLQGDDIDKIIEASKNNKPKESKNNRFGF